jgi:uncharacterized phage infection (PIP) family protein YhgE
LQHAGLAISGASGAAIVVGAYEVLKVQPEQSFKLLAGWGPTFLIAIVALFVVGRFLEGLNATVRESFSMVASGVHSSAEASGRTADALTKLADQGGKQAEEVKMLAVYAAQEFPGIYERFDRQDVTLEKQTESLSALTTSMGALTSLHDLAAAMKDLRVGGKNDV